MLRNIKPLTITMSNACNVAHTCELKPSLRGLGDKLIVVETLKAVANYHQHLPGRRYPVESQSSQTSAGTYLRNALSLGLRSKPDACLSSFLSS